MSQPESVQATPGQPFSPPYRLYVLGMLTLGDEGAQALLNCPHVAKLKSLDLHHHYMSDAVMQQIQALPTRVNVDDQESGDNDDRYVAVGE